MSTFDDLENTMSTFDDRVSLLELDTPSAPKSQPRPGDNLRSMVMECRDLASLESVAVSFNADTLTGRIFRSLPKAVSDEIRLLWRSMRLALVWSLIWRSFCQAVSQGPAPIAPVSAPQPTETSLESIASESATNASASNLGDVAIGRATLGVGFSSAEGYLEALRRGVKRSTRDEYVRILRDRYGVTVDFPVRLLDENTLPVGEGVTHTPTGPSVFDLPANHPDRARFRNVRPSNVNTPGNASQVATQVGRLNSGDLIAGAVANGQGALVSWSRGRAGYRAARLGSSSRGDLLAALESIGATHLAPAAPSAAKQFGEAMRTLNANGLVTRHATRKLGESIPNDVESRFIVGYVDASADLGSLGDKRLIADLTVGGSLRFSGSETLAARVRADYEARVSTDVYTSTDLAQWLERTLRCSYHAVSCGAHLYVPAAHVESVRALIGAVRSLMGRAFQVIPVTTGADLIQGLAEGLSDEVAEISDRFQRETERARGDKRASIGTRMATTFLQECTAVGERVKGYAAMLGDSAVAKVRADLAALETVLRGLMDSTSERYAAMEMN